MSLPDREANLIVKVMKLLVRPRHLKRAEKKAAGLKYCARPPLGFRWAGTPGRQRRVVDDYELMIMGKIVEWKEKGYSWYEIASHLLRQRVRTRDGREWSVARCRRAYQAELRRKSMPG